MSSLLDSPLPIVLLLAMVLAFVYWQDRRRQAQMMAFATAHDMQYRNGDWPIDVPVPEVATLLFRLTPSCTNLVDGVYRGAHVLSFDFSVWSGRARLHGSGVAIHGTVSADRLPPIRHIDATAEGEWTYLTTKVGAFRRNRTLDPAEFQRLWDALIAASIKMPKAQRGVYAIPGGIHILPHHKKRKARS